MTAEFKDGFFYWFRGWNWLWRSRALGFYAVLPFLLALAFFISVLWMSINYLSVWTNHFIKTFFPIHEIWSGALYYPMWLTLFLLTFVALIYISYLVHILLCGPFYSLLADRALRDLGKTVGNRSYFSFRVMLSSALKSALFLLLGSTILIFSFVPLINVIGLLLALMILAFDTMDYSFEAVGLGLRARFAYFWRHLPQWVGMAVSLALTLLVPGLTLLILPGAVVGAAMIFEKGDHIDSMKKKDHMDSMKKKDHMDSMKKKDHMDSMKKKDHIDSMKTKDHRDSMKKKDHIDSMKTKDHMDSMKKRD